MFLVKGMDWRSGSFSFFERISRIKPLHRALIFLATVLLIMGIFYFLIYQPKNEAISRAQEEIEGLDRSINQARSKIANLKRFETEEAQVKAQFEEVLHLLPNEREIPSLLKSISKLGNDSRLQFPLFSPIEERPKDFYVEIPVSMELRGRYGDVALFFDKVARMDRIVNILDVSMRPEKDLSTTLIAKCTAITYRFKGDPIDKAPQEKKG